MAPLRIQHRYTIDIDNFDAFTQSGRSWHATLDPRQNALAASVIATPDFKGKAKISAEDQYIQACTFDPLSASRRKLIGETHVCFTTLQNMLGEPGEPWEDDDPARLQALAGSPTPEWSRRYYRIAKQYIDRLDAYHLELPFKDQNEIAWAAQVRDALLLATIVFLPEDGEGKAFVGEEILSWLNIHSIKPSNQVMDEFAGLPAPYEHDDFWSTVVTALWRGLTDIACGLLKPLTLHPNEPFADLMRSLVDLLRSLPRYNRYASEDAFVSDRKAFRHRARRLLGSLEASVAEIEGVRSGFGALARDHVETMQASLIVILKLVEGDVNTAIESADDWKDALGAYVLWVLPSVRRDDLPNAVHRVQEFHPPDLSSPEEALQTAVFQGEAAKACAHAAAFDPWLAAHLGDLLDKVGALEDPRGREADYGGIGLREYLISGWADILRSDYALWRMAVGYYGACDKLGRERVRACLRRVLVDAGGTADPGEGSGFEGEEAGMDIEALQVQKSQLEGSKVKGFAAEPKEVLGLFKEWDMDEEVFRLSRIQALQLMRRRKYGDAVSFCVGAKDDKTLYRIADRLVDEYLTNGPEEYIRLVDEIPASLLKEEAHLIRPDLFIAAATSLHDPTERVFSGFGRRLVFLARYRDMHASFMRGEKRKAAELLVGLLVDEAAPRNMIAVLLVDAIALLEDEQVLINSHDTYELLRCLEAIVSPVLATSDRRDVYGDLDCLRKLVRPAGGSTDEQTEVQAALKQLNVVRHALARHLGRCVAAAGP